MERRKIDGLDSDESIDDSQQKQHQNFFNIMKQTSQTKEIVQEDVIEEKPMKEVTKKTTKKSIKKSIAVEDNVATKTSEESIEHVLHSSYELVLG